MLLIIGLVNVLKIFALIGGIERDAHLCGLLSGALFDLFEA
jgi:hypothetical protein